MASAEFNLQQKKIGLEKYIKIYGIELLNKISKEKYKGLNVFKINTVDLGNLKKSLDKKHFETFIIENRRLPTISEGRSLGYKASDIRTEQNLNSTPRVYNETSPVYNKSKGFIYKKGTPNGIVYVKTKGGNQFQPLRKVTEVQKIIDDAPQLKINGKLFKQTAADLTSQSVHTKGTPELITVHESRLSGLKFPATGPKQIVDVGVAGRLERKRKIGPAQGGEISVKGGKDISKNFGHVYPIIESYKPGTKITNIIDAKKNNKLIGFNRIGQTIAEEQERLFNSKPENYKELIEIENGKARANVKNAIEKLGPGYKGDIGYFQVDSETGEFKPKAGNYKNSIAGLEGENKIYKNMTGDERKLVSEEISTKARNLFLQEATVPNSPICNLPSVAKRKADGGRIAFANGSNCAIEVGEAFDKNPKGFAQEVNKLPEESGAFNRVKSAASKFLNVAKKGGRFGAFAAVGAAGAGLVKQFTSDDPTSYLSDENQQKNMLIDMVTEPVMEKTDPGITSSAQLPVLGATVAAGMIPGGKRLMEVRKRQGAGAVRAATGPLKGLLGKGLAATGTPLGMLALEPLYIGQQLAQGDSIGDIATNPINYLGAAFAGPLSKEATRFASPAVSNIMRLGISPTMLKTVSRRFGLPGLALSAGISGYEMYQNKKAGRGLFDDG